MSLVVFCGAGGSAGPDRVRVASRTSLRLVTDRSELVIGDGVPRFAVQHVDREEVIARAVAPGPLAPRKGINVTYARPELPAITEKDLADLDVAAELQADVVALSFVRSGQDVDVCAAPSARWAARVVAKIEKVEAYEHLDEIIAVTDGVMVARGDYGVEAGVARVPLMQKDTIRATQAGKLVITATQMLESMIHAPEPTRAEATDVANAVIDGTSAVMLSAETSVGSYPVEAVRTMATIAEAAEEAPEIHGRARTPTGDTVAAAVMHSAVALAEEIDAAALWSRPPPAAPPARARSTAAAGRSLRSPMTRRVAQMTLEWGVYCCDGRRRVRRRDDRRRADRGARRRRAADRHARGAHRGPDDRHARGDQRLIMVREIPDLAGLGHAARGRRWPRRAKRRGRRAVRLAGMIDALRTSSGARGRCGRRATTGFAPLVAEVGERLV